MKYGAVRKFFHFSRASIMDERKRRENLETYIQDPRSELYIDALLVSLWLLHSTFVLSGDSRFYFALFCQDAIQSLVCDCDFPAPRGNKNFENFLRRCE